MDGRSTVMLVASVLLVAGAAWVPFGSVSAHAQGPVLDTGTNLYIAATGDYGYTPDTFEEVPTNATITVTFVDNSTIVDGHSFTIIGEEGVQIPSTASQEQIDALAWGNNPPALISLNVTALGDRNMSSFRSPGPGWYEFVCTRPSQFQLGMYGFIAFGENLPSNLTLPSRTVTGSVTNLSGSATSDSSIVLDWTNPPAGTFTNITVLYGTSNTSVTSAISVGTVSSVVVRNLNSATTYYFAIEVWNGSAHGPLSPPLALATLQASPGGGTALLGFPPVVWYGIVAAIAVAAAVLFLRRTLRAQKEPPITKTHSSEPTASSPASPSPRPRPATSRTKTRRRPRAPRPDGRGRAGSSCSTRAALRALAAGSQTTLAMAKARRSFAPA